MGKLIFITGGARSGKSNFAVELAGKRGGKVTFIATCAPRDAEMKARIKEHKKSRPRNWQTVEEETEVASVLKDVGNKCEVVIVDCLTLLLSNLLLADSNDRQIEKGVRQIASVSSKVGCTTIVVSNEVGSGIVPENQLGRRFRDIAGFANQVVARCADEVYLMVSGVPMKVKGEKE